MPSSSLIVLKAGGERTVVEEADATNICERWLTQLGGGDENKSCWCLDLSCRAWPVNALRVLQPVFDKIKATVRYLQLEDIIASLETEQGLATLQYLSEQFAQSPIVSINLNHNAIGTRGVEVLHPLLSVKTLKELHLENCGMSDEVGESVLKELVGGNTAHQLTALSLGRNYLGPDGAGLVGELLKQCTQLEHFTYAGSRPMVDGTRALLQGLVDVTTTSTNNLITLDLHDSCLNTGENDDDPVHLLVTILEHSPKLQNLIVRDNGLEVGGLELVLKSLTNAKTALITLDVGENGELGATGGRLIREFLFASTAAAGSLQHLLVDANELGDDGTIEIAAGAAACPNLQTLNLECNQIEGAGASALIQNPCPNLTKLVLLENMDLPASAARKLKGMYGNGIVQVAEDLPEDDDDDGDENIDHDVDDLANAVAAAHIA